MMFRATGLCSYRDLVEGRTVAEALSDKLGTCLRFRSVSLFRDTVGLAILAGDKQAMRTLTNILALASVDRPDSRITTLLIKLSNAEAQLTK